MASVASINCELPEPLKEEGVNVPVVPLGKPLTARSTVPENPFWYVMLAAYVVVDPAPTDWLEGVADKLKSGFVVVAGSTSTSARL